VWTTTDDVTASWHLDARFEPSGDPAALEAEQARWSRALERARGWAAEG